MEINDAKKVLADQATALCHGEDAAKAARRTAEKTFEEGRHDEGLPTIEVPIAALEDGIAAFELFKQSGLAQSNAEARRLIKGGGGKINDTAIDAETQAITLADLNNDGVIKLSVGKKRHALIRPS
ncbi:MAG: hypothetical protein HQ512_16050 [Rhodospirillales bacterium]|nr:hypothetical protein [Rhodospirillales bacterium]